jgi:tRNA(Ile)-lysidine synthase
MTPFSYQIFKFAQQSNLIENSDKIVLSISGGLDSVGLLHVLLEFREKIDLELYLAHFNHGIREESEEDQHYIQSLASSHDLPLKIFHTSRLKKQKDLQNSARNWRNEQLVQLMNKLTYSKIALAHHLNDLIETQLWRMMRGGSLYSLSPMLVKSIPYVRPLLRTKKVDIKNYLTSIKQEWREDLSNKESKYTRNKIRNKIVPIMQTCSGGKLEEKFLNLYEDSLELQQEFNNQIPLECYQKNELSYNRIRSTNTLFKRELIHQFLLFNDVIEINRNNLNKILELVTQNRGNWQMSFKNDRLLKGKNKVIYFSGSH